MGCTESNRDDRTKDRKLAFVYLLKGVNSVIKVVCLVIHSVRDVILNIKNYDELIIIVRGRKGKYLQVINFSCNIFAWSCGYSIVIFDRVM